MPGGFAAQGCDAGGEIGAGGGGEGGEDRDGEEEALHRRIIGDSRGMVEAAIAFSRKREKVARGAG